MRGMRFAALVSSSRASSLQILFCPAREVTGQTSLLDRAPNSLSLSYTRTLFPFRATRANTCEDNPCVRNVRVSNPRPPRCLVTMLQLIHDSSGYRLPSKADTFNPEFNLLSLYFSLSPSQMRSTYAKIYRSITVHDRERCC